MQFSYETTYEKIPLLQPLETNIAGVIFYNGLPVTPWVDNAYSIAIVSQQGAILYQSFYADDPTYWLRQDLATMPTTENPDKGYGMVAGSVPLNNPAFTGNPTAPTPQDGDNDTSIATTAFVQTAVDNALTVGILGTAEFWAGSSAPIGAIALDGSQLSKTTYAEAYALIGDTVAVENNIVPDSAAFLILDMRSRFFRGVDNGAGRADADRFKYYDDTFKSHTHNYTYIGPSPDKNQYVRTDQEDGGGITQTAGPTGGSETQPKSCPWLPILWVMTPEEVSAAKANSWRVAPDSPTNYHYSPDTGELLGNSIAAPSWKEPDVWLRPALWGPGYSGYRVFYRGGGVCTLILTGLILLQAWNSNYASSWHRLKIWGANPFSPRITITLCKVFAWK
ncbi:MAG: phage tail protein [Citrobacter sp.]|uniref:phage tail protein n=1 Tax=Citrobacter sp. TaxID=1896336 RepID=UPI002FCA1C9F